MRVSICTHLLVGLAMLNATQRPLLSMLVATATGLVEPVGALISVLVLGGNVDKVSCILSYTACLQAAICTAYEHRSLCIRADCLCLDVA